MGTESVLGHKLLCDLASKRTLDAPPNIDLSELLRFEISVVHKFSAFTGEIGALGIELRTDGDVFSAAIDIAPATRPATPAVNASF